MIKVGIMKRNAKTVVEIDGCQTDQEVTIADKANKATKPLQGHKAPTRPIKPIKPTKLTKPLCHFAWLGHRSSRLQ